MRIVALGASGNAGREIAVLLAPALGAGDQLVFGRTRPITARPHPGRRPHHR